MTVEEVLKKLAQGGYGNWPNRTEEGVAKHAAVARRHRSELLVVQAYLRGEKVVHIIADNDISYPTMYAILRDHGVPIRRSKGL